MADQLALFARGPATVVPPAASPPVAAATVDAFMLALCRQGTARASFGSVRVADAVETYRTLPATVRAALRRAAEAGLAVSVGTATLKWDGPYARTRRRAHAVVRGAVTPEVQLVLTLARFVPQQKQPRGARQWWGWCP